MRLDALGKKIGMSSIYRDGVLIPVTLVKIDDCQVVQVKKSSSKDGYNAVKIAYLSA